jgi:hypothetical protein
MIIYEIMYYVRGHWTMMNSKEMYPLEKPRGQGIVRSPSYKAIKS